MKNIIHYEEHWYSLPVQTNSLKPFCKYEEGIKNIENWQKGIHRQTKRQTGGWTDRQTDRHVYKTKGWNQNIPKFPLMWLKLGAIILMKCSYMLTPALPSLMVIIKR